MTYEILIEKTSLELANRAYKTDFGNLNRIADDLLLWMHDHQASSIVFERLGRILVLRTDASLAAKNITGAA